MTLFFVYTLGRIATGISAELKNKTTINGLSTLTDLATLRYYRKYISLVSLRGIKPGFTINSGLCQFWYRNVGSIESLPR